ncbi:hypothetical protein LO762_18525 [Actinocorallia sp. API 0066]|uniref:hypothetical protein n=1 Tax=Actinocorallia sp. API 0066 TaxID=2896846 RepID=UPI001E442F74|nr:hypothetical protein [Actinocorallia sp. API 0066]MCD0451179.1 hypothetical protein [Actinocorallia sp. API 0066]
MTPPAAPPTLLARLTVAPALLAVAWLVVGLPLLLAGSFTIGPALLLFPPVAALLLAVCWRGSVRVPASPVVSRFAWWPLTGVLLVTAVFLAVQWEFASEQIIVRRDPATYAQFTAWLNTHGSLPISPSLWAFGGPDPALRFDSPGFYADADGTIVPQFMAGLPLLLAFGGWIGGLPALLAMPPLLGAGAVLTFGGLTARLVGPLWAPVGAAAFALCWPVMFVSRSTYSEAAALVLLLGGLCLLHDVRDVPDGRGRAFLGGLALGLVVLVRIDGLRDILPVVVFAGVLFARRRDAGVPLAAGLLLGAGGGLLEGYLLSGPYLSYLRGSLVPLLAVTGATVLGTVLMAVLWRWKPESFRRGGDWMARGRLPDVAAVLTVLLMVAFAVRPYVQTVRRVPANAEDRFNSDYIAFLQKSVGLPVDGTRQYTELSLHWVSWYVGVPALILATFGAALLLRRILRRESPEWVLPYAVIALTTVATLLRPGITPDHPWASRRLVSIVIPGVILFAVWLLAWATRRVRRTGYGRAVTFLFALTGSVALAVPVALSSAGLVFKPVDQGEAAAVRALCRQFGEGATVLIVERVTADRFSPVIRNTCNIPTARVDGATPTDVQRVADRILSIGRRPVVLGAAASDVAPYGTPIQVVDLHTRQDGHALQSRPRSTWSLTIPAWMSQIPPK